MEKDIQFDNRNWSYVKRSVNLNNFTIYYTLEGGFATEEAAEKAKVLDDAQYELDLMRIKMIANIPYTFKEFLGYWLKDVFVPNTKTATKTIGAWGVNSLILPNIEQDVLLNYITADYVNDILNRCIPICDSAGHTVQKFLNRIFQDAFEFGYLPKKILLALLAGLREGEVRGPRYDDFAYEKCTARIARRIRV